MRHDYVMAIAGLKAVADHLRETGRPRIAEGLMEDHAAIRARVAELEAALQASEARVKLFKAQLEEDLEYFEDLEDVADGDYGIPEPNREMKFAQDIRGLVEP